ncbi:hypothetical protein TRFO_15241 [Tritrichomonas foetus]|uniref:RING-type domain-containing protein n=1 Tax=Tritrichomonas foetus TaxID=1144522 RepID=A0A1J4KTI0_9EUKA|nr:hypothetical protein TRFO_15241 [Tritrichomonas foetus]|eukprot:OHT14442.1 hypothetical protein TRFO_15241 [Tritrichomonas foetus]
MNKQDQCMICLEKLPVESGSLDCRHRFCFKCIDQWTRTSDQCPLCRKPSKYIRKYYRSFPVGDKIPIIVVGQTKSNEEEFLDLANLILEQEEIDFFVSNSSSQTVTICEYNDYSNPHSSTDSLNRDTNNIQSNGVEIENGLLRSKRNKQTIQNHNNRFSRDNVISLLKETVSDFSDMESSQESQNIFNSINNDISNSCSEDTEIRIPNQVVRFVYSFLDKLQKQGKITEDQESRISCAVFDELEEMISADIKDAIQDAKTAICRELLRYGVKEKFETIKEKKIREIRCL